MQAKEVSYFNFSADANHHVLFHLTRVSPYMYTMLDWCVVASQTRVYRPGGKRISITIQ